MTDSDDKIATSKVKAAAELLMGKVSKPAWDMGLGAVIVMVIDASGNYCAYKMNSNLSDTQVGNAVLTNLQRILTD